MKSKLLMAAVFILSCVLGLTVWAALAQSTPSAYTAITPQEVADRFAAGNSGLIVDVRTPGEYDEAHIPGAVLVPLDSLGSEKPQALPQPDQPLYVYCRTGVRSKDAAQRLLALGYTQVYDLGGIVDWPYETISSADEAAQAQEAQDDMEAQRKSFLSSFTATDLDGNPVDQSLFANHKLTMINVWATFCQPCLLEMPDLGKLSQAYADKGVQIVGLVSDALDYSGNLSEKQIAFAKEIVAATGASYPHLLPSEDLNDILLWQVSSVPTTIFVDSQGGLVGYAYIGSTNYDTWAQRIEETLALLPEAL